MRTKDMPPSFFLSNMPESKRGQERKEREVGDFISSPQRPRKINPLRSYNGDRERKKENSGAMAHS